MLTFCGLLCPGPMLLYHWGSLDCTHKPRLYTCITVSVDLGHNFRFTSSQKAVAGSQVNRCGKQWKNNARMSLVWLPHTHRSTDAHWCLVSKLRNYPSTSDSPLPVKWGTHDIYLLNSTHMNTFSWICIKLMLNTSASNISLEDCPFGGRKAGNS